MKKSIIMNFCSIIFFTTTAYADQENLEFGSLDNLPWFKANGLLKLDQRLFIGNKGGELHNGFYLKTLNLDLFGQTVKDLSFNFGLEFDAYSSKVEINDARINYSGYKGLGENFEISIGKVNPSFCLENHSDSNWAPFLESSIATTPFIPDPGLGISINKWQKDYSISLTLTQQQPTEQIKRSDPLQISIRATKAYFFDQHNFLQIGMYGNFKDDRRAGIEFATSPEAKTRSSTDQFLNTTIDNQMINSKNHYSIGVEAINQCGPFSAQFEGIFTRVNRDQSQFKHLNFKSFYVKVNYILTGGFKEFESDKGVLGRIIPTKEGGIWEVSGRYSFLDLNSKDVIGGTGRTIGGSVTYYFNDNLSISGEYLKNYIKRNGTLEKLYFDSIGARLKLSF